LSTNCIRITRKPSARLLAERPLGWDTRPFEGNYNIRRRYLKTDRMLPDFFQDCAGINFSKSGWIQNWLRANEAEVLAGTIFYPTPYYPSFGSGSPCPARILNLR
jgi:hypothetical protein